MTDPWHRFELPAAGISIDRHDEWSTHEEVEAVSQRLPGGGLVSVAWGIDATIENVLAHVGLGSGGTRTVESDEPAAVDGLPARRVRLRMVDPEAYSHGPGRPDPPEREWVYVALGFTNGPTPVLLSYSLPASQVTAMTPLMEHVLASSRRAQRQ